MAPRCAASETSAAQAVRRRVGLHFMVAASTTESDQSETRNAVFARARPHAAELRDRCRDEQVPCRDAQCRRVSAVGRDVERARDVDDSALMSCESDQADCADAYALRQCRSRASAWCEPDTSYPELRFVGRAARLPGSAFFFARGWPDTRECLAATGGLGRVCTLSVAGWENAATCERRAFISVLPSVDGRRLAGGGDAFGVCGEAAASPTGRHRVRHLPPSMKESS